MVPNPVCPYEKCEGHQGCACTGERSCEDIGKRQPSTWQEDRPQKIPTWPTYWFCISRLQDGENINFCCLSHPDPVCVFCYSSPSRLIGNISLPLSSYCIFKTSTALTSTIKFVNLVNCDIQMLVWVQKQKLPWFQTGNLGVVALR